MSTLGIDWIIEKINVKIISDFYFSTLQLMPKFDIFLNFFHWKYPQKEESQQ